MSAAPQFDVAVIGAGPTGLYAAYYAGFRGLKVAVIDSLPEVGGQISAMYPEKLITDVAGFPAIRGQELVDRLYEQARLWDAEFLLNTSAAELTEHDDHVEITTTTGETITAGALVICGGIGTFIPRELPAGSEYLGRGLRYFVPRLEELAGHDVVVVGGGDSAVDWCLSLENIARSVTLVHRRPKFRAHERTVDQVMASTAIDVLTPYEVVEVSGDPLLDGVVVATRDGDQRRLPAQSLVAALGFIADLGPIEGWGLELRKRQILVDRTMRTNRTRVFAAGDITDFDGKVRLISTGFGEAATAVNHIAHVLDPSVSTTPGHSTDG